MSIGGSGGGYDLGFFIHGMNGSCLGSEFLESTICIRCLKA